MNDEILSENSLSVSEMQWTKTEKSWLLYAKIYILHNQIYKAICRSGMKVCWYSGELNRYLQYHHGIITISTFTLLVKKVRSWSSKLFTLTRAIIINAFLFPNFGRIWSGIRNGSCFWDSTKWQWHLVTT